MSIKKSLRITFILFAIIPILTIFIGMHWFVSVRLLSKEKEQVLQMSYHAASTLNLILNNSSFSPVAPNRESQQISSLSEADLYKEQKKEIITSYFNTHTITMPSSHPPTIIITDKSGYLYFSNTEEPLASFIPQKKLYEIYKHQESSSTPVNDTLTTSNQNPHQIYSYYFLEDLDMVVLLRITVTRHSFFKTGAFKIALLLLLFIVPIALIISSLLANHYTAPIFLLKNAMRRVNNGDLEVQCNLSNKNEFGDLGRNFNKMLLSIKASYNELSAAHEEVVKAKHELKENLSEIEFLAFHDVLTKLPNKFSFNEYMNRILNHTNPFTEKHALYFIDLDNFKTINDTLGHRCGDLLLTQTAEKLISLTHEKDCLARIGGDEFLLFVPYIKSEEDSLSYGTTIIEEFKKPFDLDGETVYIAMSIGIALYPEHGIDSNTLVKKADIAMYSSKGSGKNQCTIFNRHMDKLIYRSNAKKYS